MKTLLQKLNDILDGKQKKQCFCLLLLTIAGSILELFSVSALLPFVSLLLDSEHMMQNRYIVWLCEFLSISNLPALIVVLCIALIFLFMAKNVFLIAI